jgi:small-conductance mechanosensitive channel
MLEAWHSITTWLEQALGISPHLLTRFLETLALALLYIVGVQLLRRVIDRRVPDAHRKFILKKTIAYVLGSFVVVGLLFVWLGGITGLAASIGVLSAGVAIALKDPLVNFAGWFFIAIRRPFVVGDRISIGPHSGDVIDRRLFQFSIIEIGAWVDADQSTGRVIHIPNGWIFNNSTTNFTQFFPYLWNEVALTITFESNWVRAKEILTEVARRHAIIESEEEERAIRAEAERNNIYFNHLDPIVWTRVVERGIMLTLRFLCKSRARRSTESVLWEALLRELAKADDISFAYPTTRFYQSAENKPLRIDEQD